MPDLTAVVPAQGWSGEPTTVRIEGDRLLPGVRLGADGAGTVDATFVAWLEREGADAVRLEGIAPESYDALLATVPSGLAPGVWDVRVRTPGGTEDLIENAFTVTTSRADHLELVSETAAYTAGENARVVVRLEDPNDVRVLAPMLVDVVASSASGAAGVIFADGGLARQVPLADGVGVRGALGANGEGVVFLRSDVPDDVTLRVTPVYAQSAVDGDSLLLSWQAGRIAEVDIELPVENFTARAGTAFSVDVVIRDSLGNVLEDDGLDMLLFDTCGTLLQGVEVRGRTTVAVTLTGACPSDQVRAYGRGREWSSVAFPVLPGEVASYDVVAAPAEVVAGAPSVAVLVSGVDTWGNVGVDHVASLTLRDTLGGLDPVYGAGASTCPGFPAGGAARQLCAVTLDRAGETVLEVRDERGRVGASAPLRVVPGALADLDVVVADERVAAGEAFEVRLRGMDRLGNAVAVAPGDVRWQDDTDTLACGYAGEEGDEDVFLCTVTGSMAADTISVFLADGSHFSDQLDVVNGRLASVDIVPSVARAVAGAPYDVAFAGWDAWGNAVVVHGDPVVALEDSSGTLTPVSVVLGADGRAVETLSFTRAGAVEVRALQRGVVLGAAEWFVDPGPPTALVVTTDPWVEVGERVVAQVGAVDAWGNVSDTYAGLVRASADRGRCARTSALATDGVAVLEIPCLTAGRGEVLRFDAAGLADATAPLDVLDFQCVDGPSADLTLDGGAEAVACLGASTPAVVRAELAASAGASAVRGWYLDAGEGAWSSPGSDIVDLSYDSPAGADVRAVVVDGAACAAMAEARVWIGVPDGSPTGPIELSVPTDVAAGGTARVDVQSYDCAGGPATGDLLVRVDAGVLALAGTGDGLALPLDAAGAGSVLWTLDTTHDGIATFLAGATVQARGQASLLVNEDVRGPRVVSASPEGRALGPVAYISLVFDTEVDPATIAGAVHLVDGAGSAVPTSLVLDDDGRTLRIVPDATLEGAADVWRVVVASTVTDAHGNLLDGAGDGSVAPYESWFGAFPEGPATPACSALGASTVLRPDGDVSAGADPDSLAFLVVPGGPAPMRWRWWVASAEGVRVRLAEADTATRTWGWNGASDVDRILAPGSYTVGVQALDAWGTPSAPCEVGVQLVQGVVPR